VKPLKLKLQSDQSLFSYSYALDAPTCINPLTQEGFIKVLKIKEEVCSKMVVYGYDSIARISGILGVDTVMADDTKPRPWRRSKLKSKPEPAEQQNKSNIIP
jgi:hypothetical protein